MRLAASRFGPLLVAAVAAVLVEVAPVAAAPDSPPQASPTARTAVPVRPGRQRRAMRVAMRSGARMPWGRSPHRPDTASVLMSWAIRRLRSGIPAECLQPGVDRLECRAAVHRGNRRCV